MRILVATVTAGGGHLKAAAALEEAWKTTYPSDDLKRVDLLDLVPKVQRNFYVDGYVKFVRFLREFEPQAVLCTHFLPLEVLGAVKAGVGPVLLLLSPSASSRTRGTRAMDGTGRGPLLRRHRRNQGTARRARRQGRSIARDLRGAVSCCARNG
jgi:hypothetical protein